MRPRATLLLLALLFTTFQLAGAAEKGDALQHDRLKEAISRSVATFSAGQGTNAFEELFKDYWYRPSSAPADAERMQAQIDASYRTLELNIGKRIPGSYEFIGVRRLGKSLAKFVYVQKHELYFMPLVFECYKGQHDWKIVGVTMGDSAADDLKAMVVVEPEK